MSVVGSVTGSFSGIDPIRRMDVINTDHDEFRFFNGSTAAIASMLVFLNAGGTTFDAPLPESAEVAHAMFLSDLNAGGVWEFPVGILHANDAADLMLYTGLSASIVPEPSTALLFATGLAAMAVRRRSPTR